MDIGRALKLCRSQRRMTQADLAIRAGFSVSYLSLLEKNKRDPSLSTVEKIAHALNMPLSILIFLAADKGELSGIDEDLAQRLALSSLTLLEDAAVRNPTLL